MQILNRQKGLTMWGMLYVFGSLAFFLFLLFKFIPPYLTDLKVKTALNSVSKQSDVGIMHPSQVQEAIRKRLEIDNADTFDLTGSLKIEQRGKFRRIRISYESVTPLAYNMSLLIAFDHSVDVRSAE